MGHLDEPMENYTCDCLASICGPTHDVKDHTSCGFSNQGGSACGSCDGCVSAQTYWALSNGGKNSPEEMNKLIDEIAGGPKHPPITCEYGGQCEPGQCTGPCGN